MRRLLVALVVLPMVGCGSGGSGGVTTSSNSESQTTANTHVAFGWSGLGAKLSDFEAAHPRGTAGCEKGTCYGPKVATNTSPAEASYEFVSVSSNGAENRVDGYDQTIGESVIPNIAKHTVLQYMPRDTRTLDFWVEHGSNGSCGLWNLQSATLAKWFADPKIGDPQGHVIADLYKPNANGESEYSDSAGISFANVSVGEDHRGEGC